MTIWQKMRYKMGLSANDMATKLNIDEEKYLEIERGERELPKEHINRFLGIRNEQNMNEKEMEIYMIEVNDWLKNVNWDEIEKEFGFTSHNDARKAIGIAFSTYALVRTDVEQVADKTRRKVYRFYHDELNKNVNKSQKQKQKETFKSTTKVSDNDKFKVVEKIDVEKFPYVPLDENGHIDVDKLVKLSNLSQIEIANALGIHSSCISKWKIQKQLPRYGVLVKLNDFLKSYQKTEEENTDVEYVVPKIEECVPISPEMENDVEVEIFSDSGNAFCEITEDVDTTENTFQIDESISIEDDYVVQLESRIKALERTIACYEKLIERL